MCGILLIGRRVKVINQGGSQECIQDEFDTFLSPDDFRSALEARGPDAKGHVQVQLSQLSALELTCSLLQLRGEHAASTPHVDNLGNILLFNGEIFGGLDVPEGCNDGHMLMQALGQPHADVTELLSRLRGPWALMYWHAGSGTLWFGRDCIGRRSLLIHVPDSICGDLCITSVSCPLTHLKGFAVCPEVSNKTLAARAEQDASSGAAAGEPSAFWEESEPGIYSIWFGDSRLMEGRASGAMQRHAWAYPLLYELAAYQRPAHLISPLSNESNKDKALAFQAASAQVLEALQRSVNVRCKCIDVPDSLQFASVDEGGLAPAPVLILFSGGVDSTLLAACAHLALPPDAPIDLASVCFDEGRSPDRLSALDAFEELKEMAPEREWRLLLVAATLQDVDHHRAHLLDLLRPSESVMDLNIGAALWLAAQAEGHVLVHKARRTDTTSFNYPTTAASQSPPSATAASTCCQPAHLHQGPKKVTASATGSAGYGGPCNGDPCSCGGEEGEEGSQFGDNRGTDRDSKGTAWDSGGSGGWYRSRARVVLLGHGADELCAGYGRHRTRFRSHGWEGLSAELALDVRRLWRRNLGRDDRIIADVGREARHPFLDEDLIQTLLGLPLSLVADLRQPPGSGDKALLRAALRKLGLERASKRVKRAIQFGSRLSKQANVRDFGSNRAANMAKAGALHLSDVPRAAHDR